MKVKAIAAGFLGGRRYREGDVFEVGDKVTGKWFVPVDEQSKAKAKKSSQPETFADIAKQDTDALV